MIELIFISSSNLKLSHIEYLLDGSRYYITPQRNYGIGYKEPRIYDREKLLHSSFEDALVRFKKAVSNYEDKFFIIEDTSVIVHALSKNGEEVPGLDVKYWMAENSFEDIDRALKTNGNDRSCTVRSDIVLKLPKQLQEKYKKEYMVFTGMSHGYIIKEEKEFSTTPLYPWLDNKTFNKWFVPEGYEKDDTPISMLDINETLPYDFRKNAIDDMIRFLDNEELDVYEKKPKKQDAPSLFDSATFLLVGSTCAGKSTLAEYLVKTYGYYHIEASDFMHMEYYKKHGTDLSISIGDFAEKALRDNPTIVAVKVVEHCKNIRNPIVVSGFRAKEEVEYFVENHHKKTISIFIETNQKIRFDRCKKRGRRDAEETFDKFLYRDKQQYKMGIGTLEEWAENTISNNGTFLDYYSRFDSVYGDKVLEHGLPGRKFRLEELIMLALWMNSDRYFTTTEIAKLIKNDLKLVRDKNNVSRYFNQSYHPYYKIIHENGIKKYSLNYTGESQVKYLFGDAFDAMKQNGNKKTETNK